MACYYGVMFVPASDHIKALGDQEIGRIKELESLFVGNTNVYIDYANVYGWQTRLKWKIHPRRIQELYASFSNVRQPKLYFGTMPGEEENAQKFISWGFDFHTKPVKKMRIPINATSIPVNSPHILKNMIRDPLLRILKVGTIEDINKELLQLNSQGIYHLEDLKCNFDVEIGRDMLIDFANNNVDTFVLWSGDSDFADPIRQLLNDGKNVVLFMTANRVATELNELTSSGLKMFEINKIRDFICKDAFSTKHTKQRGPAKQAPQP